MYCFLSDFYFRKFCGYLFPFLLLSVDIIFLRGMHTCQRLKAFNLKLCRSTPCWQQKESLWHTCWALTSGEIYHSLCLGHLTENFFRPRCRSIAVAAGVPACWSKLLGLRAKQVNMCALKKPCCWSPVPYAVQRGIMQGTVEKELVLSTHRSGISNCVCMRASCCVQGGNEIRCYILRSSPLQ